MAEPTDMILPLLREMRAENTAQHQQTRADLAGVEKRLEKRLRAVEEAQKSFRAALTADTLLSRLLTGEFEERIEALERKVRELESQR
jgi:hypothetical protein